MTRTRGAIYAAIVAVEATYALRNNLAGLFPPPPGCGLRQLDVCIFIQPVFPWLWIALIGLLIASAVAILLRRKAGIAAGVLAQLLLLPGLVRDTVSAVGSFLFTGFGYDGIDPDFQTVAFTFLALSIAVGPALTLLWLMGSQAVAVDGRRARIAAPLLGVQVAILAAVAVIVFRATVHDCEFYGNNPPTADGVPWCTPWAQFDLKPALFTTVPAAAVLLSVALGAWTARPWAIAGGIVWQLLLVLCLAVMGVGLWTGPSQNAWYDHFPAWTSPRHVAFALLLLVPVPTLAALLAARLPGRADLSAREVGLRPPGPRPNPTTYRA
jgi:hypothetical protein